MTRIKICGLKSIRDIEYVNELMPDYVGFVFAESNRKISEKQAVKMKSYLDKAIKTVGVFLDEDRYKLLEIAEKVKLDVIQLHGSEDIEYVKYIEGKSSAEIWKAVCIKTEKDLGKIQEYKGYRLLIDGCKAGMGECFDWSLLKNRLCKNFILAGGLNCDNIQYGVEILKPFAVDVSSGVETKGVKDYKKIKEFIGKVRQYDKR